MKKLVYVFVAVLLSMGCTRSGSTDNPAPVGPTTIRAVWPPATDGAISVVYPTPILGVQLDSHFVYINRNVTAKNRLFVFLPGTTAVPRYYRAILQVAADAGYHAIGLTYVNPVTVASLCGPTADADCIGNGRFEILDGTDRTPAISISRANSIENRLIRLIAFLQAQFPAENWGQFAPGGNINWGAISVAGHSQGGGHAAFIGKVRGVLRAASFSAPGDFNTGTNSLPNWVTQTPVTPVGSFYGFTSLTDELALYSAVSLNWSGLGLPAFGAPASVDANVNAAFTTRQLTTTATPRNPALAVAPNHNVTVVDVNTPLNADGTYTFAPIWRYMCLP
jgi:hypothetical protein